MSYTNGLDDPSAYFHIKLYNGNGSTQSITNDANAGDFKPDWLWTKSRNDAFDHITRDSSRGVSQRLITHSTAAEDSASGTTSFDTNGFSLDSTNTVNKATDNYVAWQWKANGSTTSSNTDGDITSTVQVNTTAGFSIVSYTGNGTSSQTVGHGLGAVPDMLIVKNRTGSGWKWDVWHSSFGDTDLLRLDQTTARETSNGDFDALPTSSVFTVGTNGSTNENSASIIAYCFSEVQGYSSIKSYTGNGNADGPFIYTGFKPAWVMIKRTSSTGDWLLWDNKRDTFNVTDAVLKPNSSAAENTGYWYIDFLSNGFKIRATDAEINQSGGTFIYLAFASSPFVSSEGVPTTAR